MNSYLYTWNPTKWDWSDLQEAIYLVNNDKQYDMYWSCGNTKRIVIGDMFFLARVGTEPKGIIGCGYISSAPYYLPHWDKKKAAEGKSTLRTDLLFKTLSEVPIASLKYLQDKYSEYNWTPQSGGLSIPDEIASELLSTVLNDDRFTFTQESQNEVQVYAEGKAKTITHRTYDRSPAARQACIEHYGYNCSVCGFSFESAFGDLGRNYIEVHHLKQVADVGGEYTINPITDLRPVCANCHRMLHKRRPALSIEELKSQTKSFRLN